jgi:CBS domain containing-hemolysin-like protein
MDLSAALAVTIIAILFSAFFSGAEIAFVQSNKVKIEIDATKKGLINRVIHGFARNVDMFISTLLVGNNIALVIYGIGVSVLINPILRGWFGDNDALVLVVNTLVSTAVILITGEFLPKTVFRINPNFTMRIIAIPLYVIYLLLYPLSLFTSWLSRGLMAIFGIKGGKNNTGMLTIDQIDDYIQQSIDEAPTDESVENEVKIFRNAIDFKDTQVGECMRPRNEITAVDIDTTDREELINTFVRTGLSKIVVYHGDIDNVLGYIHVSEIFTPSNDWKKCLKPVIFTPETMLANKLMRRLLAEKRSMAIIIDEFGGTAGLVTLEDLVEEIFGEFEDEHDQQRLTIRPLSDGDYEVSGREEIEHLNEELKLNLKESDTYHTLAGYILDNLEALPNKGDTFVIGDVKFTILAMTDTRIEWIHIHKNNVDGK